MTAMGLVQFTPFVSLIEPSFWHTFSRLKLDELHLSDELVPVQATYSPTRAVLDRVSNTYVDLGCRLRLGAAGLAASREQNIGVDARECVVPGVVKNFNTLQEFKKADKRMYFYRVVDAIWQAILSDQVANDPSMLNQFLLLTYADLKTYRYYYWFAFPALLPGKAGWMVDEGTGAWRLCTHVYGDEWLAEISAAIPPVQHSSSFLLRRDEASAWHFFGLGEAAHYFAVTPKEEWLFFFVDPSPHEESPGWPLRNMLTYLLVRFGVRRIRTVCWKDPLDGIGPQVPSRSVVADIFEPVEQGDLDNSCVQLDGTYALRKAKTDTAEKRVNLVARAAGADLPEAAGWERNAQGKLTPKLVSLGAMLDPKVLAEHSVDLNLKLMRWRAAPELALDPIQGSRVLIIGAGTLGCYMARTLMGWGVRHISFIDSGHVSYSNPVRQPLYEFADCLEGGRPKAKAAADAMRRILPSMHAEGHQLAIPMPGHPVPSGTERRVREELAKLEALIEEHTVVFLATDTRESRWLPTVLARRRNKLMINAALGFDSYLVMRHGVDCDQPLGCYFCSDVVAPSDSLTDRTLDQMCTVARPGGGGWAGAAAVELMVSVLQNPLGAAAPALLENGQDDSGATAALGIAPHQIRGFLTTFSSMNVANYAFAQCTACSPAVLRHYEQNGPQLVLDACSDPTHLEWLTGLEQLKAETDALELELAWDEDSQ